MCEDYLADVHHELVWFFSKIQFKIQWFKRILGDANFQISLQNTSLDHPIDNCT